MTEGLTLLNSVLKKFDGSIYSEKAISLAKSGVLVLKFAKSVHKNLIKSICENMLGVSVVSIRTLNVKAKTKVFKGVKGKRASFKKAYVRVSAEDAAKMAEEA